MAGFGVFTDEDAWDVTSEISDGSAAAMVLPERCWAIPLRDAVAGRGGFRPAGGASAPLDPIGIGMVTAELHALETATPSPA